MTMTYRTTSSPVFAIHASASGPSQWHRLSSELADRHHVITPDLNERLTNGSISSSSAGLNEAAEHVACEIEACGEPVHLIGHSFGGAVSLKVALTRPELVASLTLYEPAALFLADVSCPTEATEIDILRTIAEDLQANTNAGRSDLGVRQFIAYWNGADRWDSLPESTRLRLADMAPSVIADFTAVFSEDTTADDLARINVPTLIMSGMDSPVIAQRIAACVAGAIAGARLAILPVLGHMAPLTDPEWVNPRICQHIAEVERNAAHVRWPRAAAA